MANDNKDFTCHICRTIVSPAVVTDADRDYWLDRYSMEWIVETARNIWGKD
jgi:hypothetical protein